MKTAIIGSIPLGAILLPTGAFAHGGHLGTLAGHDHVVIGVVLGGLVLAGLLAGAAKGKKTDSDAPKSDDEGSRA